MIDVKKLLQSKRVEVTYWDPTIDGDYIKEFRKKYNLTQVALANIIGVTKKAIEKWEGGSNKIKGCAAILIQLLDKNPELIKQLCSVKIIDEDGSETDLIRINNKNYDTKQIFSVYKNIAVA